MSIRFKSWKIIFISLILLFFINSKGYTALQNWNSWVTEVKQEALAQGISSETFDKAFADIHEPSKQVRSLAHSQPEHRLTYSKYLHTRADTYRINVGRQQYIKNKVLLEEIANKFHVDPCFIVAFWGMETSYGSYMGNFPVIKSLATLAYDSNRKEFFRKELFLALHIVNDGHITLDKFKGEWAGASGQSQFLPSSWLRFAVDYDGDGRKDIWESKADVFASIANYMQANGWHIGEPWAIFVKLPSNFDKKLIDKNLTKQVKEWNQLGVRTENNKELPYQDLKASIIQPYGGPIFLAYPNYRMILYYNNSIYYAGAIGYIADKICNRYQSSLSSSIS